MARKKKLRKSPTSTRTPEQKQVDGLEMVRLFGQGKTQHQIAAELSADRPYKISRKMVSDDLGEIIEKWKDQLVAKLHQIRFQEIARLNRMEEELWKDYEGSGGEVQTTRQRKRIGKNGETNEAEVTTRRRVRNPIIMQTILQICERRSKLLGLDAPTKIANADGSNLGDPGEGGVDLRVTIETEKPLDELKKTVTMEAEIVSPATPENPQTAIVPIQRATQ